MGQKKAYEINRRIKAIFDPNRILNPDVIITDDPDVYKKTLRLNALSMMLSQSVWNVVSVKTLSKPQFNIDPRQRIALLRETKRLENEGNFTLASELRKGYEYLRCRNLCSMLHV